MPDEAIMGFAVRLAELAAETGERPFGCVVVDEGGAIIGKGSGSESELDPTRHSELDAIREACEYKNGLLQGCTLYSTHEPCMMCIGAILHAKVSRVVWGSRRSDLPLLFRKREVDAIRLFHMTTHPPVVRAGFLCELCVRLFDDEVAEMQSALGEAAG